MSGKSYRIENFGDIVRDEPSRVEGLLHDMDELWDEFELPPGQVEGLGGDNWNEILLDAGDYARLLFYGPELIGYWFFIPITQELYTKGRDGENINKIISPDDVPLTLKPGFYRFYFVDFIIKKLHHRRCLADVWNEIEKTLADMAKNKIFIWKIIANASTSQAINICRTFNFEPGPLHKEHLMFRKDQIVPWQVFELNFAKNYSHIISSRRSGLIDKYFDAVNSDIIIKFLRHIESENIEFKLYDNNLRKISKSIAGLAGSGGGACLIGVADEDREIAGVNLDGFQNSITKFTESLANSICDNVQNISRGQFKIHSHLLEGKWIVVVEVEKADVQMDGGALFRVGPSTRKER